MAIPVGGVFAIQYLTLVEKTAAGEVRTRQLLPVRFVPLTRAADDRRSGPRGDLRRDPGLRGAAGAAVRDHPVAPFRVHGDQHRAARLRGQRGAARGVARLVPRPKHRRVRPRRGAVRVHLRRGVPAGAAPAVQRARDRVEPGAAPLSRARSTSCSPFRSPAAPPASASPSCSRDARDRAGLPLEPPRLRRGRARDRGRAVGARADAVPGRGRRRWASRAGLLPSPEEPRAASPRSAGSPCSAQRSGRSRRRRGPSCGSPTTRAWPGAARHRTRGSSANTPVPSRCSRRWRAPRFRSATRRASASWPRRCRESRSASSSTATSSRSSSASTGGPNSSPISVFDRRARLCADGRGPRCWCSAPAGGGRCCRRSCTARPRSTRSSSTRT